MIVYRYLTQKEADDWPKLSRTRKYRFKNLNTFSYEEKQNYRHFAFFAESAVQGQEFGNKKPQRKHKLLITKFDFPREILEANFGYGYYDGIVGNGYGTPLPEVAIPAHLLSAGNILDVQEICPEEWLQEKAYWDFINQARDYWCCYAGSRLIFKKRNADKYTILSSNLKDLIFK